jgi:beta-hydroxylase
MNEPMSKAGHLGRLYITPHIWVPQAPLEAFNLRMGEWLRHGMPALPKAGAAAIQLFPRLELLRQNHAAIKEELKMLLASRARIPELAEIHPRDQHISSSGWTTFVMRLWGRDVPENSSRCPRVSELVATIPGVHSALFSILGPGAIIPPHRGWAAGVVRCHYPLMTPADFAHCAIEVDGVRHSWREAEPFLFDDTQRHSVRNETAETRIVLILDIEPRFRLMRRIYSRIRYHFVRNSAEIHEICARAARLGSVPV